MDPVTHTLTGFALSRTGFRNRTAHSLPVLLLAAHAPDIDLAAIAWGQAAYLEHHRTITHSVVAAPFLAALAVLAVRPLARKRMNFGWAWLAALAGVASHLILDWLNVYGVRLLWPFSVEWRRLDSAAWMDIWIWAALLLAAAAPFLSRLVGSEIGAKANPNSGRAAAILALCFVGIYAWGRTVLHDRAVATLDSRLYGGAEPTSVIAVPDEVNPFGWRGVVETGSFYTVAEVNLLLPFDPEDGSVFHKPQPTPLGLAAERAARKTEPFQALLRFAQYPLWRFTPVERGIRVEVMDLRFGAPPRPRFAASAIVTTEGRVVSAEFRFRPSSDSAASR